MKPMIFLNYTPKSVYSFNKQLLAQYKRTGDSYLADIRRNMSKQLTDYGLYYYLQNVNNAYYVIIGGLLDGTYENSEQIYKDQKYFEKCCDEMLNEFHGGVPEAVYDRICVLTENVQLLIQKLINILNDYCLEDI